MSKRAAIYARVSSNEQAEKGYGLPTQLAACRKYAEDRLGAEVVLELAEDISGAVPIIKRRKGSELVKAVHTSSVECVVVYSHDRVSRDDEAVEFLILHRDCVRNGIELHTVERGKVSDSPYGRIIDFAKATGAAEERAKIRERTMRGRKAKAEKGKWVGCGNISYGYRAEGLGQAARLEIDEAEAVIVWRIFAAYVGLGGEPPKGLMTIAAELTAEGVPPPNRGRANKSGWRSSTVLKILRNRVYLGEFHYSTVTWQAPELALIAPEVFERAQEQRQKNMKGARRNQKRLYLLSGHIRCSCDKSMAGHTYHPDRQNGVYYECTARLGHAHLTDCKERAIPACRAETLVWERLLSRLKPDVLEVALRDEQLRRQEQAEPLRAQLATLEELINDELAALERLAAAIQRQKDKDALKALERQLDQVIAYKTSLEGKQQVVLAELESQELSQETIDKVKATAEEICRDIENAEYEDMRYLLNRLGVTVKIVRQGEKRALELRSILECEPATLPL